VPVVHSDTTSPRDMKTGEGVLGLRRAFSPIGVKSLVMSMWKIPDKETKELMV
jgi:CHAT domain-containing protein